MVALFFYGPAVFRGPCVHATLRGARTFFRCLPGGPALCPDAEVSLGLPTEVPFLVEESRAIEVPSSGGEMQDFANWRVSTGQFERGGEQG